MFDYRSVFATGLIVLALFVGTLTANTERIISGELLDKAGLDWQWQIQIPLKPKETLDKMYVYQDYLYLVTSLNTFFCVERTTSDVRAVLQIAEPGLPVRSPMNQDNKSGFLVGQVLKIFDPSIGRFTRTINLLDIGGNYGEIARNKDYIYICSSDNRLTCFSDVDDIRLFSVTADNDSPIFTVAASDERVWFGTRAGNIYAMQTTSPDRLWKYNISGKMEAGLILDDGFIYAGGMDTKVYKLDAEKGKLVWKEPYFAGDQISTSMMMGKSCVYVYTVNTGLHAVHKETGVGIWNVRNGYRILSESGSVAYVYSKPGFLTMMDNTTGKEMLKMNIALTECFAVNMIDSAIYLADKDGRVAAIAPKSPAKNNN